MQDSTGLDLGFNYTAIYQRADTTVRGPRDASGGDLDFFGRWHLLGCEDHSLGALVFSSETRDRYAHRGLNRIRQNISAGVGAEDVFGQNDDLIGVAASWAEPSGRSLREQYTLEAFYRLYVTPHTHLTPDIQVVIDPANAPTRDAVIGPRLRTLFYAPRGVQV